MWIDHRVAGAHLRASFAAYDVEFVVEVSRCRAPLHRSTGDSHRPAANVELYSSTVLQSALHKCSIKLPRTTRGTGLAPERKHGHKQKDT